MKLFKN